MIRNAVVTDHNAIAKIAKLSPYTSAFTNHMFSSPAHYAKGWIKVMEQYGELKPVALTGFVCIRHKTRSPETVVYFLGTHPEYRRTGIGGALLDDVMDESPSKRVFLKVALDNLPARDFYLHRHFKIEKQDSEYYHMAWTR